MEIDSLDEFFAEYTVCERLGKEYYLKAIETKKPELLTSVVPAYEEFPRNLTRGEYSRISVHRHERYVYNHYHSHEKLELMYMYSGQCSQTVEGYSMILREHECCFISPRVFHAPQIYDDSLLVNIILEPEALSQLCLDLEGVGGALTEYIKSICYSSAYPNFFYCRTGGDEKLHSLLCDLIREYFENKKYCGFMMRNQLNEALGHILRCHEPDCGASKQQVSKAAPVLPILQYIHDHYRSVTLQELSERFSYSEQHICRMIKAHTGRTFSRHIIDLRISQAKLLLLATEMSFSEIAWHCGYSGEAYFHRLFTGEVGVTPAQYRRMNSR